MRKRRVWVESLFGEAKDFHPVRRFRLRGLLKVNIEGVRVAAGQNLKRLIKHKSHELYFFKMGSFLDFMASYNIYFSNTLVGFTTLVCL